MPIVLNGTSGITTADGSAALPSLTGSDTNTGFFQPAADTIACATGGVERWRTDSSGNVGIGVTAPAARLDVIPSSSGSTATKIFVKGTATAQLIYVGREDAAVQGSIFYDGSDGGIGFKTITSHALKFGTNDTERARITSDGYFKASNNGTYVSSSGGYHELRTTAADWTAYVRNVNASPYGLRIDYVGGASPNGVSNQFLYCYDNTALRAEMRSNGGLANYSANNVNLSDRREKTNFAPAKNYLETLCAIPVQTFNYIDQNRDEDDGLTLGVVAQDVQEVAPELVMESNWGTADEPKMRLSIYQTDLQYAMMKAIQELKAELDAAKARIAALEVQP